MNTSHDPFPEAIRNPADRINVGDTVRYTGPGRDAGRLGVVCQVQYFDIGGFVLCRNGLSAVARNLVVVRDVSDDDPGWNLPPPDDDDYEDFWHSLR